MNKQKHKQFNKAQRANRIRKKVIGSDIRPRLSIYRSLKFMYVQLIDDINHVTLAYADDRNIKEGTKKERAFKVGELIAQKAKEKKIEAVVFDRGANKYHGRVEEVAKGARKAGLQF